MENKVESNAKGFTENEWEVYGVPSVFLVDNGSDFASKEFKRVAEEVLKSEVRYCPPGQPEFKGAVERFYRTLNQKVIHELPGTTKSNPEDKGQYNSEKHACLTLKELEEVIIRFLVDIYPFEEHKGLPPGDIIPLTRYKSGLEMGGPPKVLDSLEYQEAMLGLLPEKELKVTKKGLTNEYITYWSISLQPFVTDGLFHKIKFDDDDDDVSHCYFYNPVTEKWIEILALNPSYKEIRGLSLMAWKKLCNQIRKNAENKAAAVINDTSVRKARRQNDDLVKKAEARKKRQLRDKERMKNQSPEKDLSGVVENADKPQEVEQILDEMALDSSVYTEVGETDQEVVSVQERPHPEAELAESEVKSGASELAGETDEVGALLSELNL